MISYLHSAHQHRTEGVMKLFESEIFRITQSTSFKSLQLYSGTMSDMRKLAITSTQVASPKSGIAVELYPIINLKQSFTFPTFSHFSETMRRSIS